MKIPVPTRRYRLRFAVSLGLFLFFGVLIAAFFFFSSSPVSAALFATQLHREKEEPRWTEEELRVVEQAINQIGPALENARLLEEAQTRAAREQTVNMIAAQVRNAAGIQGILQNTVRELGKALGVGRSFIQIGVEASTEKKEEA